MEQILTFSSVVLLLAGVYFTVKLKAFYLFHPIMTFRLVPKDGVKQMLLSLGGTVGVGNIVGVAVAIAIGGSGAVFWMWFGAILAMGLKYAEITLGMLYGNSVKYIKKALGGAVSGIFALLLVIDSVVMGSVIQSNAISEAVYEAFGISRVVTGIFVGLLVAVVFFFNVDLFKLSAWVVPIMSIGYAICAVLVIVFYAEKIPQVVSDILKNAFRPLSATGGALGFLFTPAMRQGIVKGLFSNEAGCGTAPMAHAAAEEKVPARQGLFGIIEVFVDTVLMCTLTAFVILLSGVDSSLGIYACIKAFESVLGGTAPAFLAISVFLFAFSATVSFGYYGVACLSCFGKAERYKNTFLLIHSLSVFVGATVAPVLAWEAADLVVCAMLLVNTLSVFILRKNVTDECEKLYSQMGKYSHKASSIAAFSDVFTKNEIPMSDTEMKRGSISNSRQNLAK